MDLSQVQRAAGVGFIPDAEEDRSVPGSGTLRAIEGRRASVLYEVMMLTVSLVLLLFGLLPSQKKQNSSTHASSEKKSSP